MMQRPLIFITNDDGVQSKGLAAIVEVASRFGRVIVVAPKSPQSGMSHAITMGSPLFLKKVKQSTDIDIYSFSGTPVDCVKIAFDSLMLDGEQPSLILSGINHGSNSAINILYSGTMGAAIEASFYDIPSVGLSLLDHDEDADFEASKVIAERIISKILSSKQPKPMCLNVNIPMLPIEQIKGIKICRQNRGYWREEFQRCTNPRGEEYYWLTGVFKNTEPEATDTDEWALNNGYVSMVPVQVDLTNYAQAEELKEWNF